MFRIVALILLCFFSLLNNVENIQLTKDKFRSRSRQQSTMSRISSFNTSQLHRCYSECTIIASFNDSLILPNSCHGIETNHTCEMVVIVDYSSQAFLLYGYKTADILTIDNTIYNSATTHLITMAFNDSTILHMFNYICATGDYCEWKEMQRIIPELIALDYQPLYDLLLPTVFNSNGRPRVTQCYNDINLVNCTTGLCRYYQTVDDNYQLETIRSCSSLEPDIVEFEVVRHLPGPSKYDYSTVIFVCDQDQCNDEWKEIEIREIISSNGNEYLIDPISSSNINHCWSMMNFFFFYIIIIQCF